MISASNSSVEAWYDTVYQRHTANNSPATYNPSVPSTPIRPATVNLDGQYADLGDTFVYGNLTCRRRAAVHAAGAADPVMG